MKNNREVSEVLHRFESGAMTRRNFVRSMTLLGVSTFVTNAVMQSALGATRAFAAIDGPEERAWALAKEAAAKASKKTLTVLIRTGSIGNMTPYVDKWKTELGISIEFIEEPDEVVHTKGMQEAVAKTGRYDVMMPTAMSYPDWIDSGVIYDLTEWVQKYDPKIFNKEWGVGRRRMSIALEMPGELRAARSREVLAGSIASALQFTNASGKASRFSTELVRFPVGADRVHLDMQVFTCIS